MEFTHDRRFRPLMLAVVREMEVPCLKTGLLLFTIYFAAAFTAIAITGLTGQAANLAFIWPAGPVLVAFLFKSRPCEWLPLVGIAGIADLSAALIHGASPMVASLVALIDVLGPLAIAVSAYVFNEARRWFASTRNIAVFSAAVIIVPMFAAGLGSAGLAALGEVPFIEGFQTWFAADVLAYFIFTPFFLSWIEPTLRREVPTYSHFEGAVLTALLALGCYLSLLADVPILFVIFPLAMLLTIRTGLIGATLGPITVAAVTLIMTTSGIGPFAQLVDLSWGAKVQLIQLEVLALALTLFPAAVMLLRLRTSSERADREAAIAAAAFDNMAQGISMFDQSGIMITCNRQYRDLYGLPEHLCRKGSSVEDIVSHQVALGICPGDIVEYERVLSQKETHQCSELNLLNGRIIQIRRRMLENGNLVATHEDVTDQRTTAKRIAHLASHDPLTQLANRTQFMDRLNSALSSESSPFALHTIDLDCFKEINDTLGHPAGDAVLEAAAQRISSSVRKCDLVARLGGDEFAVLQLVMSTPEDAPALAARLACDLSKPVSIDGTRVDVSASIGVALCTGSKILPDTLMRMSDTALYCAKAAGRSTFRIYEPEMDLSLREKKRLEREIKAANPRQDFELHYQPILDLHQGEVASFEALIRWRHPVDGLILPDRFIVAAEESGAITSIGNWAIHSACLEATKWPKAIKVAVNVSPVQLRDPGFLDSIASAIDLAGIAPHRLQIEITESVLLQDMDETLRVLERLKAIGVGLSIDDFGTGYASLSYLRKFPFDTLKIDQSFIREMAVDAESFAIIESTLGLAHRLGMGTVAEGVETVEQMNLLRAMKCSRVQGYLINRPHPASAIPAMLARDAVDPKNSNSASQLAA